MNREESNYGSKILRVKLWEKSNRRRIKEYGGVRTYVLHLVIQT